MPEVKPGSYQGTGFGSNRLERGFQGQGMGRC